MEYVFTAIFHENPDGSYTVTFPDLAGCISEGKTLANAMYMAQSALTQWLNYLIEEKQEIPKASDLKEIKTHKNEFKNYICAVIKDGKAVKRTVSIPQWMDKQISAKGLKLSSILQEALAERLK